MVPNFDDAKHTRSIEMNRNNCLPYDVTQWLESFCFVTCGCLYFAPAVDYGHLSFGKVQYHAPATNISHYNYTKIPIVRSESPEYTTTGCSKSSKVKRNKSSSAADAYLYRPVPETKRLLSDRKCQLNRSNPNLWESSQESRPRWSWGRGRSGSHPSLAPAPRPCALVTPPTLTPIRSPPARSARSSTWCCGSFVKQLTKSHHFD